MRAVLDPTQAHPCCLHIAHAIVHRIPAEMRMAKDVDLRLKLLFRLPDPRVWASRILMKFWTEVCHNYTAAIDALSGLWT